LIAVVPAWVPGSQQDAHEILLSIFQILDEEDRGGSQCIVFKNIPLRECNIIYKYSLQTKRGKHTKGKVLIHTRHKCQSNSVLSGPKRKQININVNPKYNP